MTPEKGRLREYATGGQTPLRVDAEKGIIYNVLVLGHRSSNGAEYKEEVMRAAQGQYAGSPVFVGHARDGANPLYDDKLGFIDSPHVSLDGLRGDFHFPPKHRLAEQLVWDAQNNPQNLGFSHDADCTWTWSGGCKQVTSIDKVYSVDLVTRPATTGGLFEEQRQRQEPSLIHREVIRREPTPGEVPQTPWRSPWEEERERTAPVPVYDLFGKSDPLDALFGNEA
jgi:hypothetical protein